MARQVAIPYTFTTDVATYDSANSTFYQQASGYPPENGLGDGTGTYAGFHLTRGSGAVTTIWYGFNCDDIPSDATITGVTLSERASMSTSTTNYVSQATLQLYSGTTAKGSATSILKTTAQYFDVDGGSNWTVAEIKNCRLRAYAKRGSKQQNSQYTMRLFGGTLTVNYTLNGMIYTITTSTTSEEIIAPSTQEVYEGRNCSVSVTTDSLNNHTITDNNINVTSQFTYVPPDTGGTMIRYPNGYITDGTISGLNYRSAIGCGVDNPSNNTTMDSTPNASTSATIYYTFDFSDLPDTATISSMSIQVRYAVGSTTYAQTVRPYKGTSGVGTAVTLTATSQTTTSITSYGTWTAAELKSDPRIGLSLSFSQAVITGITWSVTYTANEPARYKYILSNVQADHNIVLIVTQGATETFYIKQNGSWNIVSKIYLKQNGTWSQQPLSYLTDNHLYNLLYGGEYEAGARLPSAYQEVEYVSVSSAGPYIDTGVQPRDTEVEITFQLNDTSSTSLNATLCGAYQTFGEQFAVVTVDSSENFIFEDNSGNDLWSSAADTNKHTFIKNNANHQCLTDNTVRATSSSLVCSSLDRNIYLFGCGGTLSSVWKTGKIYYCKITNNSNNTVLREFIPCYRKSDNEIGFYDLRNNQFYSNNDTSAGSFGKGPNV